LNRLATGAGGKLRPPLQLIYLFSDYRDSNGKNVSEFNLNLSRNEI